MYRALVENTVNGEDAWNQLVELLGRDEARNLLDIFEADAWNDLAKLQNITDKQAAMAAAHKLKGSCGNLGMLDIADALEAWQNGDLPTLAEADALVASLREKVAAKRAAL